MRNADELVRKIFAGVLALSPMRKTTMPERRTFAPKFFKCDIFRWWGFYLRFFRIRKTDGFYRNSLDIAKTLR